MSHKATSWAVTASKGHGLSWPAKGVLWHLADRHNPEHGCFPSQSVLVVDCEVSKSQLNVHLATLERVGLIRRVRQMDEKTRRQRPTRYLLAFEQDFEPLATVEGDPSNDRLYLPMTAEPSPDSGHGADSGNGGELTPVLGGNRIRIAGLDTEDEPVKEPVKKPCASRVAETQIDRDFADLWATHPKPRDRKASRQLFRDAVLAGEDAKVILGAARRYASESARKPAGSICQSDGWLKASRWRDEAVAADAAEFWADKIRKGRYVPSTAITHSLARDMVRRGLIRSEELAKIGMLV